MSQPVRHTTRWWIRSIPMLLTQDSPESHIGYLWPKLSVPSSNRASSPASVCQSLSALATLTDPPANQGRHRRPSASRRAIRQPTPVG